MFTVNNRLIFENEIVHDLSCHSILYGTSQDMNETKKNKQDM